MSQLIGIILHFIGGFSSASFYVPYNFVKKWSWQIYWISLGFVAWMVMPWIGGFLTAPHLIDILRDSPLSSKILTYTFGILWGFGGLGAGLALRYLGLSLGQSISLGVCAIVGTIVPAIMDNKFMMLFSSTAGIIITLGFMVCIAGIILCGYAGVLKDKNLTKEQKQESVKEFSAAKGITMAVFGGVMSACMAIAIKLGGPIANHAIEKGTQTVFMNNPSYVFILAGGFTTNFIYTILSWSKTKSDTTFTVTSSKTFYRNSFLAMLSGIMWYGQFFFYGMGTTKMGEFDFASWSIHMASIIIFSNLWGLWLKEWQLVSKNVIKYLLAGIILLIISVVLIGFGNYYAS